MCTWKKTGNRELKSVKVMGLCKKKLFDIIIILLYNKHQKGDNRKIEKMPEARAQSMQGTNICLLQLFHSFIFAWALMLPHTQCGISFLRGLLSLS